MEPTLLARLCSSSSIETMTYCKEQPLLLQVCVGLLIFFLWSRVFYFKNRAAEKKSTPILKIAQSAQPFFLVFEKLNLIRFKEALLSSHHFTFLMKWKLNCRWENKNRVF